MFPSHLIDQKKSNTLKNLSMKTITFLTFLCLAFVQKSEVKTTEAKLAEVMLEHFFTEEYQKIIPLLHDNLKKTLTVEQMKEVSKSLKSKAGTFKEVSKITEKSHEQYKVVEILCHFEKGDLISRVTFNPERMIEGWFFLPAN